MYAAENSVAASPYRLRTTQRLMKRGKLGVSRTERLRCTTIREKTGAEKVTVYCENC